MRRRALAAALALPLASLSLALARPLAAAGAAKPSELHLGRFGRVVLHSPAVPPSRVALLAAGEAGEDPDEKAVLREATEGGALVIEFDARTYLRAGRGSQAGKGACAHAAADLEALSQQVQKQLGLPVYRPPILVGFASGATLVEAALGQAPPNTFRGAIALRLGPAPPAETADCSGHGASRTGIEILPEAGKPSRLDRFRGAWAELSAPPPRATPPAAVADLPLVEVPAKGSSPGAPLAVVLSGDGGWAGLDRELAQALSERGIPTVGLNTLSYFWTARNPDGMAADLSRVLRHYLAAWRRDHVLLIGYSYGAEVLPFMASRLPKDLSARVEGIAMLAPGPRTAFEFHVGNWLGAFGAGTHDEHPVLPEVKRLGTALPGAPILCLYGEKESDSLCPEMRPPLARSISFPGAHHFGGGYGAVADRLIAELAPRALGAPGK